MPLLALACQAIDQKLHLRSISPEYEILLLLYDLNVASPSDLLKLQHSSNSTFYKNIGYLQQKGLIKIERDGLDRRHSLYSLTDFARDALDEKWEMIQAWTRGRALGKTRALPEP